jgi:hypothetical protein
MRAIILMSLMMMLVGCGMEDGPNTYGVDSVEAEYQCTVSPRGYTSRFGRHILAVRYTEYESGKVLLEADILKGGVLYSNEKIFDNYQNPTIRVRINPGKRHKKQWALSFEDGMLIAEYLVNDEVRKTFLYEECMEN